MILPADPRAGLLRCNPTHQQIIRLNLYRARPCPPEQDPVFPIASPSLQEAYTSLLASSIKGQTEAARRSTASQQLTQKQYYRKLIMMEKQKVISQIKTQDKISEKQLNKEEIGNLSEKEFRIVIVKMIQDLRKRMEAKINKIQEMFTKDLEELNNKLLLLSHFSHVRLCNPIDNSPPGSTVPGILWARTLEWVAISFSNCEK